MQFPFSQQAGGEGDPGDPRVVRRKAIQAAANQRIAERQHRVIPEQLGSALWSFQVPWAPFANYLAAPCPQSKPFLWSAPFSVGVSEWMLFLGVEPIDQDNSRCSLWVGVCNNLTARLTAYTKVELLCPGKGDMGTAALVGDAVDMFDSCGQQAQKKFGRFWWHLSPSDFSPKLFRGTGDGGDEESFELLVTVRLNPANQTERSPATEEDPRLWEAACQCMQHTVAAAVQRATGPLEARVRELEVERGGLQLQLNQQQQRHAEELRQKDAELARQAEAHRQETAELRQGLEQAQQQLRAAAAREQQLQQRLAAAEEATRAAQRREEAMRAAAAKHEAQMREAAAREQALRQRQGQLEEALRAAAATEERLRQSHARLEQHIQSTGLREQGLQREIGSLERQVQQGRRAADELRGGIALLQRRIGDQDEREEMLRDSNRRLYQATADRELLPAARSTSPHHPGSPPRVRALARPLPPEVGTTRV